MNEAQAARLLAIIDEARAILAGENPAAPGESAPIPDGMVAVHPSGVRGAGKRRLYPDAAKVAESLGRPVNLWGYHSILSSMLAPDGRPFVPAMRGPYDFSGDTIGRLAGDYATFPEAVDRIENPGDWATAAEIEMAEKLAARDRAAGTTFSPR